MGAPARSPCCVGVLSALGCGHNEASAYPQTQYLSSELELFHIVSITLVLSNYLPRSISQETFLNTALEHNTLPFEPNQNVTPTLPRQLSTRRHHSPVDSVGDDHSKIHTYRSSLRTSNLRDHDYQTVASFLAAAAYRLVLHPLRQYPGPILCAVSSLPRTWQAISGNEHMFLYELHMKYGPAVRLGPNELSFIDAQAWKDIYGHRKAGKPEFTKDPSFFDASANGEQDIIRADKATHSRFRKVFSNSFSDRALKQQESLLKQHVNKLIRNLTDQAKKGSPVDMAKQYNFTTFDIMADLTFSESLGLLDGNDYNDWVRAIVNNWQFIVVMRMLKSYKKLFTIISRVLPKKWQEERLKLFSYAVERVDHRLERGTTKSDIWDQMQQRDASITVSEMHANAEIFMIAGSETTATLLSGLTYYLLTNPDTMEKLKQEIRTACPTEEDLTVERLQELKYLHACVEEGLRHYSPSVIGHVRIVPEEGAFVCGRWMPGGVRFCFSPSEVRF